MRSHAEHVTPPPKLVPRPASQVGSAALHSSATAPQTGMAPPWRAAAPGRRGRPASAAPGRRCGHGGRASQHSIGGRASAAAGLLTRLAAAAAAALLTHWCHPNSCRRKVLLGPPLTLAATAAARARAIATTRSPAGMAACTALTRLVACAWRPLSLVPASTTTWRQQQERVWGFRRRAGQTPAGATVQHMRRRCAAARRNT